MREHRGDPVCPICGEIWPDGSLEASRVRRKAARMERRKELIDAARELVSRWEGPDLLDRRVDDWPARHELRQRLAALDQQEDGDE